MALIYDGLKITIINSNLKNIITENIKNPKNRFCCLYASISFCRFAFDIGVKFDLMCNCEIHPYVMVHRIIDNNNNNKMNNKYELDKYVQTPALMQVNVTIVN